MSQKSHLEERFWHMLGEWGLQALFQREYKFHAERRWKFDFCNPSDRVAVEIEGGVFGGGRHNWGPSFVKDAEKYNTATAMGFRIFRFSRISDMKDFYNLYAELLENDLKYGAKKA